MSDRDAGQRMLSKFGAGDTENIDLLLPEDGVDLDAKREVEAYAEDVTRGGWELVNISNDRISWSNPDGAETYWIERKKSGWHGKRGGRDVEPHYTTDLQEALDGAGEFLDEHPVERDADLEADGGQSALEVLYDADVFERVHLPAIDVTVTVVDRLSMFENTGLVGADDDGEAYLLLEDTDEDMPEVRVEKWNGNTYEPVMRASTVEHRGEGADGVLVVPHSASSEAKQIAREAARDDSRVRPDGGETPAVALRQVSREDQVTITVDGEEIRGRVAAVDDAPEPAAELLDDPVEVSFDTDERSYRALTYRTITPGDPVFVERDREDKHEEDWEPVGNAESVEVVDE